VHDEDDDETFGNIREDDVYEGYDTGDWVIVSVIGFSFLQPSGGMNPSGSGASSVSLDRRAVNGASMWPHPERVTRS